MSVNEIRHLRKEVVHQLQRKELWKRRCHVATALAIGLGALCLVLAGVLLFRPSDGPARLTIGEPRPIATEIPAHVWATVIMYNGDTQCSATLVARDETHAYGIGCGHCFAGRIGGKFWVHLVDGKTTASATLLAHDTASDLSLFSVPLDDRMAIAPVPESMPTDSPIAYDVIGFPGGQGPKYFPLDNPGATQIDNGSGKQSRWTFAVKGGKVHGGNSGCGVFVNGMLCGVVSHRSETDNNWQHESADDGRYLFCASHATVKAFLVKNRKKLRCQDLFCLPNGQYPQAHQPPRSLPQDNEGEVAPPPPDTNDDELPPGNPRPWVPNPNVKLPPYGGKGSRPEDLNSDRKMAAEIDKLRHALTTIEERIGKAATPADVAALREHMTQQLGGLTSKLDAAPKTDPAILEKLAALQGALGKDQPVPLDVEVLKLHLQEAVRIEAAKVLKDQGATFKTAVVDGVRETGIASLPDVVRGAAGEATSGAVAELKGDMPGAVAAKAGFAGLGWGKTPAGGALAGTPVGLGLLGFTLLGKLLGRKKGTQSQAQSQELDIDRILAALRTQHEEERTHRLDVSYKATTVPTPGEPFPVVVQSPAPIPAIQTETLIQQVPVDEFSEAYAWARGKVALMQPQGSEAILGLMESLIKQYLAGKGKSTHASK